MAVEGTGIDKEEIFLIFKSVPKKKKKNTCQVERGENILKKNPPGGKNSYLSTNLDMLNLTHN